MTKDIYQKNGFILTRYVGPLGRSRYQITVSFVPFGRKYVTFSIHEIEKLSKALGKDLQRVRRLREK
jgi:hypothetical protein